MCRTLHGCIERGSKISGGRDRQIADAPAAHVCGIATTDAVATEQQFRGIHLARHDDGSAGREATSVDQQVRIARVAGNRDLDGSADVGLGDATVA